MATPTLVVLRSREAVFQALHHDGSSSLTYQLPQSLELTKPHKAKLLFLLGGEGGHLICRASFVAQQIMGNQQSKILGTSVPDSNVYVALDGNYVPAVGWLSFERLDGSPILEEPDLFLAIHICPCD